VPRATSSSSNFEFDFSLRPALAIQAGSSNNNRQKIGRIWKCLLSKPTVLVLICLLVIEVFATVGLGICYYFGSDFLNPLFAARRTGKTRLKILPVYTLTQRQSTHFFPCWHYFGNLLIMLFQLSTSFHYSTVKQMLYVRKNKSCRSKMSFDLISHFLPRSRIFTDINYLFGCGMMEWCG
jgi:hypothetical protein